MDHKVPSSNKRAEGQVHYLTFNIFLPERCSPPDNPRKIVGWPNIPMTSSLGHDAGQKHAGTNSRRKLHPSSSNSLTSRTFQRPRNAPSHDQREELLMRSNPRLT